MSILSASWMLIGTCERTENGEERGTRESKKRGWGTNMFYLFCVTVRLPHFALHPSFSSSAWTHSLHLLILPPSTCSKHPSFFSSSLSLFSVSISSYKEGLSTVIWCVYELFTWQALVCDETCSLPGFNPVLDTKTHTLECNSVGNCIEHTCSLVFSFSLWGVLWAYGLILLSFSFFSVHISLISSHRTHTSPLFETEYSSIWKRSAHKTHAFILPVQFERPPECLPGWIMCSNQLHSFKNGPFS